MRKSKMSFTSYRVLMILISCALAATPRAALAHAVLVSAQPGPNSTVAGPDVDILLKYNSRIDREHSTLVLHAPDGKEDKVPIGSESAPGLVSAKLTGLVKGAYELRWQVLATDGHVTRGKLLFQIK
jgi:methionine-rich copper-binding protein CopC